MATNSSGSGCSKDGEGMDCEHNNVDPKVQKIATFWSSRRQLQGWRFKINIKVWATIVLKALWAYLLSVQFYCNTVSHLKLNQMLQLLKKSMIITLRSCHYNKIDFCRNWALLKLFSPAIVKILSSNSWRRPKQASNRTSMLHHPCVPSKNSSFKQHESQHSGSLQASLQSGGMQRSHQRLATETPSRCPRFLNEESILEGSDQ